VITSTINLFISITDTRRKKVT